MDINEYNKKWFDKYRRHLEQPKVRHRHDDMFAIFDRLNNEFYEPRLIVDLGCATQEYYKYGNYLGYFGIDKEYIENEYDGLRHIAKIGDYIQEAIADFCPFKPGGFVSLFSTEIFMSANEKYEFYEKLFIENPTIQVGMVAGYYYNDYSKKERYTEPDGFTIYQTVENQMDYRSNIFEEFRTYIDGDSEMFKNGIEVWKMFRRINVNE